MGIPSSETALEEVMCHVLGSVLREESVAKSADDLYCGGNTAFLYIHNDVTQTRNQLWIITDGALRDPGIGATLYVTRRDKSHVSVQRVHYWPTPSFGWPFDRSSHTTQSPILSPVEDGRQMLSIRYRSGQGHLLSLMDAIPAQQYKALQPHVLNSPLPHHPTLLVGPFPQMSSNALTSLSLSFTLL